MTLRVGCFHDVEPCVSVWLCVLHQAVRIKTAACGSGLCSNVRQFWAGFHGPTSLVMCGVERVAVVTICQFQSLSSAANSHMPGRVYRGVCCIPERGSSLSRAPG